MQPLEQTGQTKEYEDEMRRMMDNVKARQKKATPVEVKVFEDYKAETVVLAIGEGTLTMTLGQARNLAVALRQSAHRVEKDMMARGVFKGKSKPKRGRR